MTDQPNIQQTPSQPVEIDLNVPPTAILKPTPDLTKDPLKALEETGFKVDLSDWRMASHTLWQKTASDGDLDAMSVIMAAVIKSWPYEGDPTNPSSYSNLWPREWKEAVRAVGKAVGATFR